MIGVADTTPLNYLILIQHDGLLPRLFDRVLIPPAVYAELQDPKTPMAVKLWFAHAPVWLKVQPLGSRPDQTLDPLDPGEREAIALAEELKADRILLDEAEARQEAAQRWPPPRDLILRESGADSRPARRRLATPKRSLTALRQRLEITRL